MSPTFLKSIEEFIAARQSADGYSNQCVWSTWHWIYHFILLRNLVTYTFTHLTDCRSIYIYIIDYLIIYLSTDMDMDTDTSDGICVVPKGINNLQWPNFPPPTHPHTSYRVPSVYRPFTGADNSFYSPNSFVKSHLQARFFMLPVNIAVYPLHPHLKQKFKR